QRRRNGVRDGPRGPRRADCARGLVVAPAAGSGEARGAGAARARAPARLAARGVALQDSAQGLVRRRLEGAALARVAAASLEPRRAGRDLRLVPREPRPRGSRRCHAPRAVEPAGAGPAEEDLLMLFLSERDVRELLDLDQLVDALADAHVALSEGSASMPPRIAAFVEEWGGLLGAMPAYVPGTALTCK